MRPTAGPDRPRPEVTGNRAGLLERYLVVAPEHPTPKGEGPGILNDSGPFDGRGDWI